jgi:hypothetical protein
VLSGLLALGTTGILASVDLDHAVYARVEAAAGVAPAVPNGESERAVSSEASPSYALRGQSPRLTFGLRAGPRFEYQWPLMRELRRPLVLGRAEGNLEYRLSERWTTAVATTHAYGEIDYSQARLALRTPLASSLDQPVLSAYQGDGRIALTWLSSMRSQTEIAAVAGYSRPLTAASERELATTTRVGGRVGYRYELDPRSSASFAVDGAHYFVKEREGASGVTAVEDVDSTQVSGVVGYRRALSLRTTFDAGTGVTMIARHPGDVAFLPNGRVLVERVLHQNRGVRVVNGITASLEAVYDPTLGVLYPVAGVEMSLTSEIAERWRVTFLLAGFAAATPGPLSETVATAQAEGAAESRFNGSLSVARDITALLDIEFGYRVSADGSHLGSSPYELMNRQAWVFVALSGAFGQGMSAADGRWVR